MPSLSIVDRVEQLVGTDILEITDRSTRWPALGTLLVDGSPQPVALYLSVVALGGRKDRYAVERRFQNPANRKPIIDHGPDRRSLLLGLWTEDQFVDVPRPLLVAADPVRRQGKQTRWPVFVLLNALRDALRRGWSESQNASQETIHCFSPPLLPAFASSASAEAFPPPAAVEAAIDGSGLLEAPEEDEGPAAARARRAISTLVRDAGFSRRVLAAYDRRCAMCGLGSGLIEGAHIYPASAPGSADEPWNGLALCANHHRAFDRHIVAVRPDTRGVLVRETQFEVVDVPAAEAFVRTTFDRLARPSVTSAVPRPEMFTRRYQHFPGLYDWI